MTHQTASLTPTIHLRAIEPEDLDLLYRIENDPALWNVGNTNVPYSRFDLHEYIAHNRNDIYTDRQVRLMMENEQKQIVGIVDLINFVPTHLRAEVGIVVEQPFRRCGYATSALSKIAVYAKRVLHLHQLYAVIKEDNQPALCLFRHAGYKDETILHQWLFDGMNYHNALLLHLFL